MKEHLGRLLLAVVLLLPFTSVGAAQDYSVLRINEVISENETQSPYDVGGEAVDMVEIYNSGTEPLVIGLANSSQSLALSDTATLPLDPTPWTFPTGHIIQPGKFIIVFCDEQVAEEGTCELHASFSLTSDGTEPITLWGPVTGSVDGKPVREIIDQVWLPPLRADVSIGRFPDGAGPAPVPLDQVLDTFHFYPPGTATFGSCIELPSPCAGNTAKKQFCPGASNATSGGPLAPSLRIAAFSTNQPAAGEGVELRALVRDEKSPAPPNMVSVDIVYRVNEGPETVIPMVYDAAAGVVQGKIHDNEGNVLGPNPFSLWTYWDGTLPGLDAGSRVTFYLRGLDADGLVAMQPDNLCPDDGPSCNPEQVAARCESCRRCSKPYTYRVAYEPSGPLAGVVINEIVPRQRGVLMDRSQYPCSSFKPEDDCSRVADPCCQEDFLELYNGADQAVDLSGFWLSDRPFAPQRWRFPAGSVLAAGGYWIVWLDDDGGKCPEPPVLGPCVEQECPDPSDPAHGTFHTNFAINSDGDTVFLFGPESESFGVVHGLDFLRPQDFGSPEENVPVNHSLIRMPDGTRKGCWVITAKPTPRAPNDPGDTTFCISSFRRGDANDDCKVNLSDGVYTLQWLFQAGPEPACQDAADADDSAVIDLSDAVFTFSYLFLAGRPIPDPGSESPGLDPTVDGLTTCRTACR